jgi:ABC-type multidrug transport system ATPase subunit
MVRASARGSRLLPQRLALEPELTVAENVLLPASLRGSSRNTELLERLGLAAIAGWAARDTSLGRGGAHALGPDCYRRLSGIRPFQVRWQA